MNKKKKDRRREGQLNQTVVINIQKKLTQMELTRHFFQLFQYPLVPKCHEYVNNL
jgi:hypothetical protein